MPIKDQLTVTTVALDDLELHPQNPHQGDVGAIAVSLQTVGQYRAVVVQRSRMRVCAGNHTVMAARSLGWPTIEAHVVDVDDETALRILVGDNRNAALGFDDDASVAELLSVLVDSEMGLLGTGYDADDLDTLLLDLQDPPDVTPADPGDVPDAPVSRSGDVWHLGAHRVICGDATDAAVLVTLMAGERANCVWTDPPYGVSYVGKTADALTIENDDKEGLLPLLNGAFASITEVAQEGAAVYVAAPSGPRGLDFGVAINEAGWKFRQILIWDKQTIVLGHSDYQYAHELIMFAYTPGGGRRGRGGDGWYGDNAQRSVLSFPKPTVSKEHPTMKPVGLIAACLVNSTPPGGIVLDPFGGSGSTLIAAETLGRQARLVEIDPRYVDVIADRYERTTGDVPRLERDGTFTEHTFATSAQ